MFCARHLDIMQLVLNVFGQYSLEISTQYCFLTNSPTKQKGTSCGKTACSYVYIKSRPFLFLHFYLTYSKMSKWKQLVMFTCLCIWQGPLFLLCLRCSNDGDSRPGFDSHHFLYGGTAIPFQCGLWGGKSCSKSLVHYLLQYEVLISILPMFGYWIISWV